MWWWWFCFPYFCWWWCQQIWQWLINSLLRLPIILHDSWINSVVWWYDYVDEYFASCNSVDASNFDDDKWSSTVFYVYQSYFTINHSTAISCCMQSSSKSWPDRRQLACLNIQYLGFFFKLPGWDRAACMQDIQMLLGECCSENSVRRILFREFCLENSVRRMLFGE